MNVQSNERYRATEQLITALLEGRTFQQASFGSQAPVKRAMAYRLLRAVRTQGTIALQDRRHWHPSKLRGEVRVWLETSCRAAPHTPSSVVQTLLQERFGVNVSISQINRVRADLGVSNPARQASREKKLGPHCLLVKFLLQGCQVLHWVLSETILLATGFMASVHLGTQDSPLREIMWLEIWAKKVIALAGN
jgi:transposase